MTRRGLSLLELIFTATLLALVFMVMLNLLPSAMMSVRQSEHRVRASALAQAIMDELSSMSYTDLEQDRTYIIGSPGDIGAMLARQERTLDDGTVLEPTLEVSGVAGISRRSLAHVRLTLSWKERTGPRALVRELDISSVLR